MNPPVIPPPQIRNPLPVILGITLTLGLLLVLLVVVGVTSFVRLGRDARALRNSVMKSVALPCHKKIELGVGSFTLNVARAGLDFVQLDPLARQALQAVRGAEVGIYQLDFTPSLTNRAAMLSCADDAMSRRGWDRLVGVMNRSELVAAYVPKEIRSPNDVKICLVVLNGRDMVVASARSNLEPLVELALNHPEWRPKGRMPFQLSAAFK